MYPGQLRARRCGRSTNHLLRDPASRDSGQPKALNLGDQACISSPFTAIVRWQEPPLSRARCRDERTCALARCDEGLRFLVSWGFAASCIVLSSSSAAARRSSSRPSCSIEAGFRNQELNAVVWLCTQHNVECACLEFKGRGGKETQGDEIGGFRKATKPDVPRARTPALGLVSAQVSVARQCLSVAYGRKASLRPRCVLGGRDRQVNWRRPAASSSRHPTRDTGAGALHENG